MAKQDFDNLPEIIRGLETEVQKAVREAVETLVVPAAKAAVPKDTGRLADAIHTEIALEGVYVIAGDKDAFYGHIIEHGGVNHPPHPFLVPALEANREAIVEAASEAIKRATR